MHLTRDPQGEPSERLLLCALLVDLARAAGGAELDCERDLSPHEPIDLT